MLIKIKNYDKYIKKHPVYYYNNLVSNKEYNVYCIVTDKKNKTFYLIKGDGILFYISKKDTIILDETIPKHWKEFNFNKRKSISDSKGEYTIAIKYYYGPSQLIEERNFLADVALTNFDAYQYFIKDLQFKILN